MPLITHANDEATAAALKITHMFFRM